MPTIAWNSLRNPALRLAAIASVAVGAFLVVNIRHEPPRAMPRPTAHHRIALRAKPAAPRVAAGAPVPVATPSAFAEESAMSYAALMQRWQPEIHAASRRFAVPELWIHAVMMIESGGRTMMGENAPIKSSAGAMGLMQIMPQTWQRMRRRYGLGSDPNAPRDNIMAGAAYLRELYDIYGYPGLFAAYNDGPGMLEAHRRLQQMMPAETTAYVWNIASILSTGARLPARNARAAASLQPPDTGAAPVAAVAAAPVVVMRQRKPADGYDDEDDER
jgi:soluble lytic murein transglycosylase-like protein